MLLASSAYAQADSLLEFLINSVTQGLAEADNMEIVAEGQR